jgi:AraC-like DNA-binding protein
MGYFNTDIDYAQNRTMDPLLAGPLLPPSIIGDEAAWRSPPVVRGDAAPRIHATRWASSQTAIREVSTVTAADGYVVGLVLRPMDIRLSVAGRVIHDGLATPGMLHVSEPETPAQGLFRGPYDALHLHVPDALLQECAAHRAGGAVPARLYARPAPERDPIALQLGLALLKAEEFGASFGWIYADGISVAIVSRLLALQARGDSLPGRSEAAALAKWRLRRAIEFIDAHLDQPLSLADVARAAGLSRMHFAAQFKAATGCRPHEYLLQRRISRAQQLMSGSDAPLVQISLQVGFQSQAHFTTVFRRLVGLPPNAWRQSCAMAGR